MASFALVRAQHRLRGVETNVHGRPSTIEVLDIEGGAPWGVLKVDLVFNKFSKISVWVISIFPFLSLFYIIDNICGLAQ